jgi:hypothetical protein
LRGATFKLKGTPEDNFHFWIIVGYEKHGRVLAINVTDEKWSPDSPCKISVGDHPVIETKRRFLQEGQGVFSGGGQNRTRFSNCVRPVP